MTFAEVCAYSTAEQNNPRRGLHVLIGGPRCNSKIFFTANIYDPNAKKRYFLTKQRRFVYLGFPNFDFFFNFVFLSNVPNRSKIVFPKFQAERSLISGVNGRSKFDDVVFAWQNGVFYDCVFFYEQHLEACVGPHARHLSAMREAFLVLICLVVGAR